MSAGRLAEALAAHQRIDGYHTIGCTCGIRVSDASAWPSRLRVRHHAAHLAAVVLDLIDSDEVREAVAEELHDWQLTDDGYAPGDQVYAALAAIRTHLGGER